MSSVTILRILPELLRLNGSLGNAEVLATRLRWWGIDVTESNLGAGQKLSATRPDLIVIGHGTSSTLAPAAGALEKWRATLQAFVDDGSCVLGVGLGGDLLGQQVRGLDGGDYPGLGLTSMVSQLGGGRASTELVGRDRQGRMVAGYLNDQTIRQGGSDPALLTILSPVPAAWQGSGAPGSEGVATGRVWASALSGPLLALNPHVADDIIDEVVAGFGASRPEPTESHRRVDEAAAMARTRIRERLGVS